MDKRMIGKIRRILLRHRIRRAAIFGSFARGEGRKTSDVDILFDPPSRFTLFNVVEVKDELENALRKDVDLVSFRSIDKLLRPYIIKNMKMII